MPQQNPHICTQSRDDDIYEHQVKCELCPPKQVCEKNKDTSHDFSRDPIQLVRKGDWLHAQVSMVSQPHHAS